MKNQVKNSQKLFNETGNSKNSFVQSQEEATNLLAVYGLSDESQVIQWRANPIVLITPNIALKMIDSNSGNRKLNLARVKQYLNDIKDGKWSLNGETIKFDENWKLIDGQHRLHAIVQSGIPAAMEISIGMKRSAFSTIDTGKARNGADVLSIFGVDKAGVLNSALRAVIAYERMDEIGSTGHSVTKSKLGLISDTYYITNDDIENAFYRHQDLADYIPTNKDVEAIGARALFGALHYLCSLAHKATADKFFEALYHGMYHSDVGEAALSVPTTKLRNVLTAQYAHRKTKKYPTKIVANLVISTWNYFMTGRKFKALKWSLNGKQERILKPNKKPLVLSTSTIEEMKNAANS